MSGRALGVAVALAGLALGWWWVGLLDLVVVWAGLCLTGVGTALAIFGGQGGAAQSGGGVAAGAAGAWLGTSVCPDCGGPVERDKLDHLHPACPACACPLNARAFVLQGSRVERDESNGGPRYSDAELSAIDKLRGRAGR